MLNVAPHAELVGNALYEYLPALSRGTGQPSPTARVDFTTVELEPGSAKAFEAAISALQPVLQGESLWYRMVAGGAAPRYVRLRPRLNIAAVVDARVASLLPDSVAPLIAKSTIELLTLRPGLSYNLKK